MKFNTMWERPNENNALVVPKLEKYLYDCNTYRPGARDENGKLINDTRFDKVVKGQKTSLQDYIQSFEDETDIYKILERCARSGDYSILLADNENYGDCTMFSTDRAVNDKTLKDLQTSNSQAPKELAEALLSGLSDDDILAIVEKLKGNNNGVEQVTPTQESEVINNA